MAIPKSVLQREVGSPGYYSADGWYFNDAETTPELQFPNSIAIFDRMRRTDAQVQSVLRAISLPIRAARWSLVGSDVRPEVMEAVRINLGLMPEERGQIARDLSGVIFQDYLRHALLHVPLGFMAFEQVYKVGAPGPGLEALGSRDFAHLRKLAPRMPRQVSGIEVARDGGLIGIKQNVRRDDGFGFEDRLIRPEDGLVMVVNEQEGADWAGVSLLRSSYKHYLIKEGLEKIGPMVVERNGMGLVVVHYPANTAGARETALAIARNARAGEDAGIALPDGYSIELVGVSGALKDELPLIKYHAEAIGKNALTMLLDLGHDAGARALGDTFLTFLLMALDAIADHVAKVTTRHVIADFVSINFGAGETYPVLRADPIEPNAPATTAALKDLVDSGIIVPDDELEVHERRRYGLPIRPGLPTEPVSDQVDKVIDVPGDEGPPNNIEPDPQDPGPERTPPEEPDEGAVPVKPHTRRKPKTASTESLERRLATVQRQIAAQRGHPGRSAEAS